jgi:hypothetical protein
MNKMNDSKRGLFALPIVIGTAHYFFRLGNVKSAVILF